MARKVKSEEVSWKPGFSKASKVDAAEAHVALERIRKRNGGEVTPDSVIDAARSASSPLHDAFEWDDSRAAEEHRREQARCLLRSLVVTRIEAPKAPTRVYEVVRREKDVETGEKSRRVYSTTEEVLADPDARARLLSDVLRQLVALRTRYRQLQELAVVWRSVDAALEKVEA